MYQILLVDDEWLELDTLEKYIPWSQMGFKVAGTARNGREALTLLEKMEEGGIFPDLLLTDVKMPLMDGIELGRQVRAKYPDMQIVFMSGYHEFEYVRSALVLEACDYILKPLSMEELKKTIDRVKEKCSEIYKKRESRTAMTTEAIKKLLGHSGSGTEEETARWEELRRMCNASLGVDAGNSLFYLALITVDDHDFLKTYHADRHILDTIFEKIGDFVKAEGGLSFRICDESWVVLSGHCLEKQAREWMENKPQLARWITCCLYCRPRFLEQLHGSIHEMQRFRQWAFKLYGSGQVISCDSSTGEEAEGRQDRRAEIVSQVKLMIQKEYGDAVTIESLADRVYMSPNYLRTLFKEYTGKTIWEYLTQVRMRQSVILLTDTNLRVHDISKRVGYENPSHYCSIFRKQMGMTPNQYREQLTKK